MKFRASTYALVAVFISLSAISVVAWLAFPRNAEGKSRDSWMLRPDAQIDAFSISVGNGERDGYPEIRIEKKIGKWLVFTGETTGVPADQARVESFLEAMKRKRPIWHATVSGRKSGIDPNGLTLRLYGVGQTIVSEISFLGFDASAARIRFRSTRDVAVLETEDDVSAYLSLESRSWLDHAPFRGLESTYAVQRAIIETGEKRTALTGDAAQAVTDAFTALICRDSSPIGVNETPLTKVSLEFGDLSSKRISIFSAGDELIIVDEGEGLAWRVSAWSAQRLLEALGK